MTELSLGHMAFILFSSLRKEHPDNVFAILKSGVGLPPEAAVGAEYPPGLHVTADGDLTVLSLVNSLLVALSEPRVAIVCRSGPAGEALPTVTDVLLIGPNDEVLYGDGEEDDETEEDGQVGGAGGVSAGPAAGGDSR